MRDLPEDERPREKLLSCGAKNVSDAELLAILLRTGTKQRSVIRVAEEVLSKYKDKGLHAISHMTPRDISTVPGVGPAKAATVIAAVELGKRIASRAALQVESIRGPEDAANYAMPLLRDEVQEHFAVILLDTKNHILMMPIVTRGTLSSSVAHPREVFHQAIEHSAASIILVHNHPSGKMIPSNADNDITRKVKQVGGIMNIRMLDHVIVSNNDYYSYAENGRL